MTEGRRGSIHRMGHLNEYKKKNEQNSQQKDQLNWMRNDLELGEWIL